MKRVLLCECNLSGHRRTYLSCLSDMSGVEIFVYAPMQGNIDNNHYIMLEDNLNTKNILTYWNWIRKIHIIAQEKQIDIVHILDGDSIMRYFGFGLSFLGLKCSLLITYHHFFEGAVRKYSYRMMNMGSRRMCVAHTESVAKSLRDAGVKNVSVCRYPAFDYEELEALDSNRCKVEFGVPNDIPVIGIIGGMQKYKNIIPFLETLQKFEQDFHLLICGAPGEVTQAEIEAAISAYSEKTTVVLRHLTNEEYRAAVKASDIIYCLYNKQFDGASGPLTDGVCAKKMILACKHGSLGDIVEQNELGFTADCDDRMEILSQTEYAVNSAKNYQYGKKAVQYRADLDPSAFLAAYAELYRQL